MDVEFVVQVVSRVVHVMSAIALLGGSIFTLCVLLPSAAELDEAAHERLRSGIVRRWKWIVHLVIALMLVSGFYNYIKAMPSHKGDGLYHALVGTKMLLALGVFFIAAALVGRSEALQGMREQRRKWTGIAVLLGVLIVALSGFVKVRGGTSSMHPAPEQPNPVAPSAALTELPPLQIGC